MGWSEKSNLFPEWSFGGPARPFICFRVSAHICPFSEFLPENRGRRFLRPLLRPFQFDTILRLMPIFSVPFPIFPCPFTATRRPRLRREHQEQEARHQTRPHRGRSLRPLVAPHSHYLGMEFSNAIAKIEFENTCSNSLRRWNTITHIVFGESQNSIG